jgi:LPXTG-motif cell wall-anchored protein
VLVHLAALAALLPAALAPAAPPPTGVTLAWATDAHLAVVLTWHETGDYADHITLTDLDGRPTSEEPFEVAAGEPDQLAVPVGRLPVNEDLRFSVQPVDADGQPLGEATASAGFDTDQTPVPVVVGAVPRPDGSVLLTWKPGQYHDDTPGDPLDLPAPPARYFPLVSTPNFNSWDGLTTEPIAGESFVATKPLPEWLGVVATPNEFGNDRFPENIARILRTDLKVSIPRTATTGRPLQVSGTSILTVRICDPGPCQTEPDPDSGRVLQLQERTGANASWHTVATTKASVKTGAYQFRITSPGTRDYRVVADAEPLQPATAQAKSYAATAAVTTRSTTGGGGLPITGAPVAWIAAAGVLLAALGAGLVLAGRRRKPHAV